jgi:hypothetical protein
MIEILLKDFQANHSEYQIENFIVGSEIHPWHRYQQCLREISSRKDGLIDQSEALESIDLKLKELNRRRFFRRKKSARLLSKKKRQRLKIIKSIAATHRELDCFFKIALDMRNEYGFDSLSGEQKKMLEAEAWREKAKWMICLDFFCFGQPSKSTLEFVFKLPKNVKRDLILDMANMDRRNVEHFLIG